MSYPVVGRKMAMRLVKGMGRIKIGRCRFYSYSVEESKELTAKEKKARRAKQKAAKRSRKINRKK